MNVPQSYEIRVKSHLGFSWAAWFEGLVIRCLENGETVLCGTIDQATLHGILAKIRDLGLPLLSVTQIEEEK